MDLLSTNPSPQWDAPKLKRCLEKLGIAVMLHGEGLRFCPGPPAELKPVLAIHKHELIRLLKSALPVPAAAPAETSLRPLTSSSEPRPHAPSTTAESTRADGPSSDLVPFRQGLLKTYWGLLRESKQRLARMLEKQARSLGWPCLRLAPHLRLAGGEESWIAFLTYSGHSCEQYLQVIEALDRYLGQLQNQPIDIR